MSDILSLIGTPRYPLRRPKESYTWSSLEGERINDPVLADVLRAAHKRKPFVPGRCYANVEVVVTNAMAYGFTITPMVGWMVIGSSAIHHCWAALYVKKSRWPYRLIDMSSVFLAQELTNNFWEKEGWEERKKKAEKGTWEEYVDYAVAWRKAFVEMIRPHEEGDIIENRVFGVVPKHTTYIGSQCTPDEGRLEYQRWHAKYGDIEAAPGDPSLVQEIEEALSSGQGVEVIAERLKKAGPG